MSIEPQNIRAWGVHIYTMLGGVIGMFALVAITEQQIQMAWLLLVIALFIDMTDGFLARRYKVREILPHFDGAKIDDIIDFLTYVWIPVLILHVAELVSNPLWLALPIIGSLYAYGRPDMKEIDGEAYFIGFPSYWNILVIYLYWLQPMESIVILSLLFFFVLSFIPTRYLYPSKNPKYPIFTIGGGGIWLLMMIFLILQPQPDTTIVLISLAYPIYYLIASFYVELIYRRKQAHTI